MRTPGGWAIAVLSIPFIGLNAIAARAALMPPPDCGDFPNCAEKRAKRREKNQHRWQDRQHDARNL